MAQYVGRETLVAAIRLLVKWEVGRTARSALVGFLVLRTRTPGADGVVEVASAGAKSVKGELDTYFELDPGGDRPYLNPFGRLEWLRSGYERMGVFTHLYPERALTRVLDPVTDGDTPSGVRFPADAVTRMRDLIGGPLPLRATASFLLRAVALPDGSEEALVTELKSRFRFSDDDLKVLFVSGARDVDLMFSAAPVPSGASGLPEDLHPHAAEAAPGTSPAAFSAITDDTDDDLAVPDVVMRRLRRAVATSRATALVGPPGTGKSSLVKVLVRDAQARPEAFGLTQPPVIASHAAEADWTARTIIGGHFPNASNDLVFVAGHLLEAIAGNRWLLIDELNRADLDRVLGPAFSFLAGSSVEIGLTELGKDGKKITLSWDATRPDSRRLETEESVEYIAGADWRMIGTYNSVDLGRVFSMGSALARRWATVPVPPISKAMLRDVLAKRFAGSPTNALDDIASIYDYQLLQLPLGPGPFIEMAAYVGGGGDDVAPGAGASTSELLSDAYVLYVGPQLRRVPPDSRSEFLKGLAQWVPGAAAELAKA